MKEEVLKPGNIPIEYKFKNSKIIKKFKEITGVNNLDNLSIDDIRVAYKKEEKITIRLIDELVLRGFKFNTQTPNSILPKFSINNKNFKYIYTEENTDKYKKINFKILLLNIVENFEIDSDLFFNYIPLESFKYFNSNIKLELLEKCFLEQGFKIVEYKKQEENIYDNTESIKENSNIKNIVMQNVRAKKSYEILEAEIDKNKILRLEDFKLWDYKNIFSYQLTPMNIKDIISILNLINYKYINSINVMFNENEKIEQIIIKEKYRVICEALKEQGIESIKDLKEFNLLSLYEIIPITKLKEFVNDICIIEDNDQSIEIIKDVEIYNYCKNNNWREIKQIDFIDIFQKFELEKFYKLIENMDYKYARCNMSFYLYKELERIKLKNNEMQLLYKRVNNYTLEAIGISLGKTRERIRQQVDKIEEKLVKYIKTIYKIFENYINKSYYMNIELLLHIYKKEDAEAIYYILKNKQINNIQYISELDICTLKSDKDIIQIYDKIIDSLGEIFNYYEELENIEEKLEEYEIGYLPIEYFENYIVNQRGYHLINDIYCINNSNIFLYSYIIKEFFKDGIRTDDEGIEKLKEKINCLLGEDYEYSKDPHAIKSTLLRADSQIILCDNNKYIHSDNVKIDKHLINQVKRELIRMLEEKENVSPNTLFEMFKDELLEKTSINNAMYLYGVLKSYYKEEFRFSRLNISKLENSEGMTKSERISDYILKKGEAVLKNEIKDKFDLSEITYSNIMAVSENLILWNNNKKIQHIDLIKLTPELKELIIEKINDKMERGYLSIYSLYKDLELDLMENKINDASSFFNVLKIKFDDRYNFKNIFIVDKNIDINVFSIDYVIDDYFKDYKKIYRDDIVKFTEEIGFRVNTISRTQKQLLKIDIDTFIKLNDFHIRDEELSIIKQFLDQEIEGKRFVILKNIETKMNSLPKLKELEWNQFIMNSIIERFINSYREIVKESVDWRYQLPIIVRNNDKIYNISDLILYIIKEKIGSNFVQVKDIKEILIKEGIIKRDLPKEFLIDRRIKVENDMIQIL